MNFSLHCKIEYFKNNNNCFPSILNLFFELMRLFRNDFQKMAQLVWMCARFCNAISLFNHGERLTEHKRFLDENLQFKAGFKWLLKEFLDIKDNKEIFDTLHTAAYGADGKFFGRWLS